MALRYLAISEVSRTSHASGHRQSELGLSLVYESETLAIFANDQIILLPGNRGAIIGHLFTRTVPARRVIELDEPAAREILSTRGEALLTRYWGGYVALLSEDANTTIIRDPSGALPCYFITDRAGMILSSDVDSLLAGSGFEASVDWDGLFLHLAAIDFKRSRTALTDIGELLAGFRLNTRAPEHPEPIWSPWAFVKPNGLTATDSAHELKQTVESSVEAWGSCFKRIGVSLSGGLDSSIVVAALRNRADQVTLLNMAAEDAEGDERHFARLAAEAIRSPMTEVFYDFADVDFSRSTSTYLPRPAYTALAMADIGIKARMGASQPLGAWMSGLGGDNVFCIMQSALPFLDQLKVEGLNRQTLRTLQDVLRLTRLSIPELLRDAWRVQTQTQGRYIWSADMALLNPHRMNFDHITFEHSWLSAPRGTPMGKAEHVASLLRIQGSIDGFARTGPTLINPLLSQPIIEMCLAIPTWQWCDGGYNRSIARKAFSDILPARLLTRRSKGGPNGFSYRLMNANRTVLKDLLLGGNLAHNGIIDQDAVAELFKEDTPLTINSCFHLAYLAEAETWSRHWQGRRRRSV